MNSKAMHLAAEVEKGQRGPEVHEVVIRWTKHPNGVKSSRSRLFAESDIEATRWIYRNLYGN